MKLHDLRLEVMDTIGKSMDDWEKGTFLETPVSYPSFSTSAFGDIIYFRNGGHTTNWR